MEFPIRLLTLSNGGDMVVRINDIELAKLKRLIRAEGLTITKVEIVDSYLAGLD